MTATATHRRELKTQIIESLTAAARVDRTAGVIRGVKLIGFESKNGRIYPPKVLKEAVHLYEGAKVNIDHPDREPGQPRKYGERFGVIRNVRYTEGQGLYGDFHFNPHHPMTEQVLWDAENNPEALGFSHNAILRLGQPKNGKEVIESIVQIRSMDLVADPATTTSLFESEYMDPTNPEMPAGGGTDSKSAMKAAFKSAMMAAIDDESLDDKATLKKIGEILKAQAKLLGVSMPAGESGGSTEEGMGKDGEESIKLQREIAGLQQRLEQYEAKERQAQRLEAIHKELAAAGLDAKNSTHVSELFSKQLMATESVDDRAALIKDRAALLGVKSRTEGIGQPVYQPSTTNVVESINAKTFASRLLT